MDKQEEKYFHHALNVRKDLCIGCTHCMTVCPTQAIRVRDGIARIIDNRCIDCGECERVCPVHAIIVEQDDFDDINKFKVRVALVPGVLIGQFPGRIPTENLYETLLQLGFTHVYEVENSAGFVLDGIEKELESMSVKPGISSFCPAVIRLIQVRYPSLTENIIRIKPPIDMSALYYRRKLEAEGHNENDIGIFYITPCAAKIASVKSPVGDKASPVDGVINMKFLNNRMNAILVKERIRAYLDLRQELLSREGILWSLTHGEQSNFRGRALAIDGIHNVSEFLERLENQELDTIDFLELRACDQSCAGGILVGGNRFLTVERLKKRSGLYPSLKDKSLHLLNAPAENRLGEIHPRPIANLGNDLGQAIGKMETLQNIMRFLPGIDCAACGSPTCQSLAEDIVQNKAELAHCVFLLPDMLRRKALSIEEADEKISKIWGKSKFNSNISLTGENDNSK